MKIPEFLDIEWKILTEEQTKCLREYISKSTPGDAKVAFVVCVKSGAVTVTAASLNPISTDALNSLISSVQGTEPEEMVEFLNHVFWQQPTGAIN